MDNSWQAAFLIFFGLLCVTVYGKVEQSEDGQSGKISFSTPDLNDEEAHSPWMPDMLKCDACRVVALQLHKTFDEFNKVHRAYKYKLPESEVLDLTEALCTNVKTFEKYGVKLVKNQKRLTGPGAEASDVPGVTEGGGKWPTSYGLKEVNNQHRLSGPGLQTHDIQGIMSGGGRWPGSYGLTEVDGMHRLSGPGIEPPNLRAMTHAGGKWPNSYGLKQVNKVNRLSGPGLGTADVPGVLAGGGKWPGRLMDMCEQYMGEIGEMEIYNAYAKNPKSLKQFEDYMCRGKGILSECRKVEEKMKKDEL